MKVLLDTNIIICFLEKNSNFQEASAKTIIVCNSSSVMGFLTAKAFADIYYILHHFYHDISKTKDGCSSLLGIVKLVDLTSEDCLMAMEKDYPDFGGWGSH